MAGLHKHKWSYAVKYAPDHFGSNKWHPPNRTITSKWINLNQLGNLPTTENVLDLAGLGYDKLLGQGSVHSAYNIKVARASSSAIEKIKAAGGSVVVLTPITTENKESAAKTSEKGQKAVQKNKST